MGVRESKVELYLNNRIKTIGGITRKWVSPGRDGVPDRIVIINSAVFFVEVKTTDGVLSPVQIREHERLISHGAVVHTVHGVEGVDELINNISRKQWSIT